MARTYIPSLLVDVHALAEYTIRYNRVLRPAINIVSPDALAAYDTLVQALTAFDALYEALVVIDP